MITKRPATYKPPEDYHFNKLSEMKAKVLLAEDSKDIYQLLNSFISSYTPQISLDIAPDGRSALKMASANDYDLYLLDIQMPEISGDKLIRLLRNQGIQSPIIAVTANAMKEDLVKYEELGFDHCLPKPFAFEKLLNVFETYIGGKINLDRTIEKKKEFNGKYRATIEKAARKYANNIPEVISDLENYHQQEDWDKILKLAHKTKGTAAFIKLEDLSMAATVLFFTIHEGKTDDYESHYQDFLATLKETEQTFKSAA